MSKFMFGMSGAYLLYCYIKKNEHMENAKKRMIEIHDPKMYIFSSMNTRNVDIFGNGYVSVEPIKTILKGYTKKNYDLTKVEKLKIYLDSDIKLEERDLFINTCDEFEKFIQVNKVDEDFEEKKCTEMPLLVKTMKTNKTLYLLDDYMSNNKDWLAEHYVDESNYIYLAYGVFIISTELLILNYSKLQ